MENFWMFFAGLAVTLGATYLLKRLRPEPTVMATGEPKEPRKPMEWRALSRDFMALLVIAGFFAILAVLILKEVPPGNKEALLIMLGVLASSYKDVVGFQWGGSYGSESKNKAAAETNKAMIEAVTKPEEKK